MTDAQPSRMSSPRSRRWIRRAALGGLLAAILAVVVWRSLAPPTDGPTYADPRPETSEQGLVTATHSIMIDEPPAVVYAWLNDPGRDLNDIIKGGSGFPEVTGSEIVSGDWQVGERVGDRRRVLFADGHFLAEEVLVDTPEQFRYQIWGFTSPLRFAVRYGIAEFGYLEEDGRTRLTWTYSFQPTTKLLRPFVAGFVDSVMSPMMRMTLDAVRTGVSER